MEADLTDSQKEKLKKIENFIQSGASLTKQILGFAKGGKYDVKPLSLNETVYKTADMFGRTRKQIGIRHDYQPDVWTVKADRSQLEQVLLNIYVNAWQAMPDGGEIHLKTTNETLDESYVKPFEVPAGHYVKLSVTDTGIGMDEATLARIFDPFFTTKEVGRGTGLGLASAYGIVRNHGGFITVYSEPGSGSTFNIYLPASDEEVVEMQSFYETLSKGTETILLVDDEELVLEVAQELLTDLGYKVFQARNGGEAVQIYEKNREQIDLVILDMIMPGLSGSGAFERLKAIDRNVKVLLSSGYSISNQASDLLDKGCVGFLAKPFSMKSLSQKLREVLEKK
jgi:two-component system, cell cycle sensor histidine kinase and response regulator CckA